MVLLNEIMGKIITESLLRNNSQFFIIFFKLLIPFFLLSAIAFLNQGEIFAISLETPETSFKIMSNFFPVKGFNRSP